MFINFEKIFGSENTPKSIKTPEVLIEYFNSIAPKGTRYTIESDGTFLLEPIPGILDLHIQGLQLENDDSLKQKLGNQYNYSNIARYAYNSQREFKLAPQGDDEILINGERLPMNLFAFNPKRKRNYVKGKSYFIIKPYPFPAPVKVELSNEKYCRTVNIQRVPNDSLDKKTFETPSDELLGLKFVINETDEMLSLSFRTNLLNEKSVRQYVEVYSLCASFIDSTIKFNGYPLGKLNFKETNSVFSFENLIFWEKVLSIEEALGVTFQPANVPISNEIINTVEELYQTLINNLPIKCEVRIDTFDYSKEPSFTEEVGKSLSLVFSSSSIYELFKESLTIPSIYGVFHCKISHVDRFKKFFRVHLTDFSLEKKMKVSKLNYKDIPARNSTDASDIELFKTLESAKSIKDYLEDSRR